MRDASRFAIVLLPAPAGPSMATMVLVRIELLLFRGQSRSFRRLGGLLQFAARVGTQQFLDLRDERVHVLELTVDRGEPHVGNFVQILQFLHDDLADKGTADLLLHHVVQASFDLGHDGFHLFHGDRALFAGSYDAVQHLVAVEGFTAAVPLDHHEEDFFHLLVRGKALAAFFAFSAPADGMTLLGRTGVDDFGIRGFTKRTFHIRSPDCSIVHKNVAIILPLYAISCGLAREKTWSDKEEAIRLLKTAVDVYHKIEDKPANLISMYLDLSINHLAFEHIDSALNYANQAYDIACSENLESQQFTAKRRLAVIYFESGDYHKALELAKQGMQELTDQTRDASLFSLADCYLACDSLEQAKAILLSISSSDNKMRYSVFRKLSQIAIQRHDIPSAIAYSDSLQYVHQHPTDKGGLL